MVSLLILAHLPNPVKNFFQLFSKNFFTPKPPGKSPAVAVIFGLQGVFDEAVTTVISAVDHSERAMVILVPEGEEVVL